MQTAPENRGGANETLDDDSGINRDNTSRRSPQLKCELDEEETKLLVTVLDDIWASSRRPAGDGLKHFIINLARLYGALAAIHRDRVWSERLQCRVQEGCRNEALTSFAGYLYGHPDIDPDAARTILHLWNLRCVPPLGPREVETVSRSILGRELRKLRSRARP